MKSLELFTGAGGLALGTHLAGFEHTALIEFNHDACETLRRNATSNILPGIKYWNIHEADIRKFDFRDFDGVEMVAGGVPCQPFSIGGKHRGVDDARDMFPEFVRAIRTLKPRAFIVENVKGLLRQSFSRYFSYIILQLTYPEVTRGRGVTWQEHLKRLEDFDARGTTKGLHYCVSYRLLNSADYGVPQTRERVFIVGFRSDLKITWKFPSSTHSEEALVREQFVTESYWSRHRIRKPRGSARSAAMLARASLDQVSSMKPWRTVRDAICDLPEPSERQHALIHNHRLNPGARVYVGHTGSYIDSPSKTLKAGVHGVPGGENMIAFPNGAVRYFTVREAARIQTFPDQWRFEGAWSEAMRQLGNAVPVELAVVVAKHVAEEMCSASQDGVHRKTGSTRQLLAAPLGGI